MRALSDCAYPRMRALSRDGTTHKGVFVRSTLARLAALGCASALLLAGCSNKPATPTADSTGEITLTVATFNEFGYDNLFAEYTKEHPNIKIEHRKAATSNEARDNMNTRLAAGSGLADIEGIEVDWLPELMQYPDKFVDLTDPSLSDRWLEWKTKAATSADGKLIGYGTDIGPEAICYRSDLFAKAGLPTQRDEVAKLLLGDWSNYFSVGQGFVAKSGGVAWFDSASAIFQGMVNQQANPFERSDGTPIPLAENAPVKTMYDQITKAATTDKLSAGYEQWSEDWVNGFQQSKFATMLCPGWMLGVIEGNAKGVKGWDIANVFPGGGGNWGGSYLTVPAQGKHPEEAKALAAWLTAPEQQIKAFKSKGTFPSQVEALGDSGLLAQKNSFFNDAPTGQILADRAKAITVQPYKGTHYFALATLVTDAFNRVDVAKTDDANSSWAKALTAYDELGLK